jgi:hypothetical protein
MVERQFAGCGERPAARCDHAAAKWGWGVPGLNRREFVLASMASVGAVPMIALGQSQAAVMGARLPPDAYAILYDLRFPESRAFGAEVARQGGPVRAIDGDITRLWFDELAPRWQRGQGLIAGMTTGRTLLCLERLAWEHRLRVTTPVARPRSGQANALVYWIITT